MTSLGEGPERHEHELTLQAILGPLLIATRGWASPEVEAAYERAHELARRSADPARALPAIFYGLASLYESRGEYRRAAEVVQQVLDLEAVDDAAHHMGSYDLLACPMFHQGRFDRAVDHAETGWELYDPLCTWSFRPDTATTPAWAVSHGEPCRRGTSERPRERVP